MFDRYVSARNKRQPWVGPAVILSVVTHAVGAAALLISAMWQLEKLTPDDSPIVLGTPFRGDPGGGEAAPPPPKTKKKTAKRPRKAIADEMTQTRSRVEHLDDTDGDDGDDGDDDGEPNGQDGGEPGGKGTVPGGKGLDLVSKAIGDADGEIVVKRKKVPPEAVPAHMIDGHRIKGDTNIVAPESVRIAMLKRKQRKLTATIKLCLSASGSPNSVRVIGSSGHEDYDAKLKAAVNRWRYRPYRVNGQAVPVCTSIRFIYRMR